MAGLSVVIPVIWMRCECAGRALSLGLENGSDAIYAPLFWFLIAGAPGVLLYRLANTMDAMWGYKTPRFLHLGWASARIDDVLNYIPARITAVLYAVGGHYRSAWHCWRHRLNTGKALMPDLLWPLARGFTFVSGGRRYISWGMERASSAWSHS